MNCGGGNYARWRCSVPIIAIARMSLSRFPKNLHMQMGALCLSLLECDHYASRNPGKSCCHEDKHKAPTLPLIRPLSLQDRAVRIAAFGRQNSSERRGRSRPEGTITPSGCQKSSGDRKGTGVPEFFLWLRMISMAANDLSYERFIYRGEVKAKYQ